MIKFVPHNEINKTKWDDCIKNSVNGITYAYSWYLDIVCPRWNALIEDDYNSVMPLPTAAKYKFAYVYPPTFTQQLGVFSTSKLSEEKVASFLQHIPTKYKYIEINLNLLNRVKAGAFKTRGLVTHLLDLIPTYEHLSSNYSTQAKRNLKKAQASSLSISRNISPKEVIALFRHNRGKEFKHPSSYYKLLLTLIDTCIKKNFGQCWGVFNAQKELCAGAFFVGSNKRVIFLFSGVNKLGYETQAMTFLINKFIESNSQREITLDFEGSMDPDIARFYKGFGSKEVHFAQVRKNTLPFPVKWIKEIQFKRKITAA